MSDEVTGRKPFSHNYSNDNGMGGGVKPTDSAANIFTFLVHSQSKSVKRGRTQKNISNVFVNCMENHNNEHSNFLYVYFTFAYYLALAPFRFKKTKHGNFEIHRWFPQQIMCSIVAVLTIIRITTTLRTSLIKIREHDPITFFKVFVEISSFIFKMSVLVGFWLKQNIYLKLIRFLHCPQLIPYNPYKLESSRAIGLVCGSYVFFSILRMGLGSGFIHTQDWSPTWWYRRVVAEARYTFFLANDTNFDTAPELNELSTGDAILAIVQALSVQWRFIVGFFVDLFILVHVLTLWAPSSGFVNSLQSQISYLSNSDKPGESAESGTIPIPAEKELDLVIKQFITLKNLAFVIGEAVGHTILPYIGEALFYYAIYFDVALMTPDVVMRLSLTFFYTSAICILTFSAEIVRKMRWFKAWLCEKDRLAIIDQNLLAIILDDMTCHSVGITASGIFTINYQFVGTILGVLITYFIIRLQSTSVMQPF